jgi:hypothetical protein
MFPYPDNSPSIVFQLLIDFFISLNIGLDLFHPEFFMGFWLLKTDRTFVPETAVDKNDNFLFCEDDIGFAREIEMDSVTSETGS